MRRRIRRSSEQLIKELHKTEPGKIRPDRKGRGLTLMGVIWILVGLSVPEQPPIDSAFHQLAPDWLLVCAWVVPGVLAIAAAWLKKLRPWAMALLTVMPGVRTISYVTAWVVYLVPGGSPGYDRGWIAAITQIIMIAFVFYVASDSADSTVEDLAHVLNDTEGDRDE